MKGALHEQNRFTNKYARSHFVLHVNSMWIDWNHSQWFAIDISVSQYVRSVYSFLRAKKKAIGKGNQSFQVLYRNQLKRIAVKSVWKCVLINS